jgi:hypothetical protein
MRRRCARESTRCLCRANIVVVAAMEHGNNYSRSLSTIDTPFRHAALHLGFWVWGCACATIYSITAALCCSCSQKISAHHSTPSHRSTAYRRTKYHRTTYPSTGYHRTKYPSATYHSKTYYSTTYHSAIYHCTIQQITVQHITVQTNQKKLCSNCVANSPGSPHLGGAHCTELTADLGTLLLDASVESSMH